MPQEILTNLIPMFGKYSGVLLDAYGVFWAGGDTGLFPGSREIMEQLVLKGKIVGILSNSTQLASKEVSKLSQHGVIQGKHFHFFISSGEIARYIFLNEKLPFKTARNKYWLFGDVHPKYSAPEAIFKDTVYSETANLDEADFIYLSIPHLNGEDQTDPELFREDVKKIKLKKIPMICTNPDLFAHEGNPSRPVVRQGSIAKMYEEMGGEVLYVGKPHSHAYYKALDEFLKYKIDDPKKILMVGDTPETDIRGARHMGMASALITQTGIMADRISRNGLERTLKELPSHDIPNYFIARFAHGV